MIDPYGLYTYNFVYKKVLHVYPPIASIFLENVNNEGVNIIKISPPEVLYYKGVLQICSKFTGEHPRRNVIPMKLVFL